VSFCPLQELHTPRSNRSVDSGLPHDDITPRSDSLSNSSSASPPDQHQGQHHGGHQLSSREMQQQHRKSNSMDDINISNNGVRIVQGGNSGPWKSYSLQRGTAGPTEVTPPQPPSNPIYEATNSDGTVVIRRPGAVARPVQTTVITDDEDPYGRCMNMRLTSFADNNGGQQQPRDPRIIDLTLGSSPNSSQNGLNNHHPVQQPYQPPPQQNFNTLPAQVYTIISKLLLGNISYSTPQCPLRLQYRFGLDLSLSNKDLLT
jgi:hypothetical protein